MLKYITPNKPAVPEEQGFFRRTDWENIEITSPTWRFMQPFKGWDYSQKKRWNPGFRDCSTFAACSMGWAPGNQETIDDYPVETTLLMDSALVGQAADYSKESINQYYDRFDDGDLIVFRYKKGRGTEGHVGVVVADNKTGKKYIMESSPKVGSSVSSMDDWFNKMNDAGLEFDTYRHVKPADKASIRDSRYNFNYDFVNRELRPELNDASDLYRGDVFPGWAEHFWHLVEFAEPEDGPIKVLERPKIPPIKKSKRLIVNRMWIEKEKPEIPMREQPESVSNLFRTLPAPSLEPVPATRQVQPTTVPVQEPPPATYKPSKEIYKMGLKSIKWKFKK